MLLETFSVMRDLPRLHEITATLIRYGQGDLVRALGLSTLLERAGRILHWRESSEIAHLEPAVRARLALEELGPTFVKLGQVLSTRVDVFPPNWIIEFEKLTTQVPPVAFEELLPELEAQLGAPPGELFDDLEAEPIAAASIAQVHRARLKDGTPVILKIRRPAIRAKIESDLRILAQLARLVEFELPEMRRYQPSQIVFQFSRSLRRELDFAMEARAIERFARNFEGDETVCIPRVFWEWTSESLNVQEYIEGLPGTDLAAIEAAGLDRKVLAGRGADVVLKMILVDGYFHADPHAGNVIYLPGNRIALLDFGMTGRLSEERRNQIVNLLASLSQKDERALLDVLLEWTDEAGVDEPKLAADVSDLVANYETVQLKDIRLSSLIGEITAIMREHGLVMPSDLTLLFKALITLEGLGRQMDPEFHMVDHLGPFVRKVITDRYRADAILRRGQRGLVDLYGLMKGLPYDLARLIKEARRGRLRIDLDLKRLDRFGHQLDHSTNRLTLGILTAALIIGSSIVMTVQGGPTLFGLPIFGLIGFLLAFVNSLWLVFSIWRSSKD
jgi:ubiquinone biosynthesis protein